MAKVDKHTPGTICWVDLMSTDAEASRTFYTSLFGWTFVIGGPESGHYGMAMLDGAQVAGVGQMAPGSRFPSAWTVYFASDNLEATIENIRAETGAVMMGPMDVMEEGRMGVFVDPSGAVFGVWQPKRHVGAQRTGEPGAMCWHEVITKDAAKARDFYCKVFGLEPKRLETSGDAPMEYFTLHKGPTTVGGVMQMNPEWQGVPPHWMAYFAVADADAAANRVVELGGKVTAPPFDTAYGRIAMVADPTGAAFSVIKLAPAS